MKIMSYEIPIYCWQLKRPSTRAARNFSAPLYLLTYLFGTKGPCLLHLAGPCSLQSSEEIWHSDLTPSHLDAFSWEGFILMPWDFEYPETCQIRRDVSEKKIKKEKRKKSLPSLCHTRKRLTQNIVDLVGCMSLSLKYFLSLSISPSSLSPYPVFIFLSHAHFSLLSLFSISLASIFLFTSCSIFPLTSLFSPNTFPL